MDPSTDMSPAFIALIAVGVVALLALIWLIATFNRLVSTRQHMRESWADIDVELKRRYDLIPNLVAAVKGYAAHESSVLEQVVRLRNTAAANHGAAAEQAVDETALAIGLKQLFAVVENYPQLKADTQFLALQQELAITEDRLAAARRFFNANVREMNQLCDTFPSNVIANMFHVERGSYFEVASDAERTAPRVAVGA
ncbi:LemA family protein [Lacipirellula sp.]|uniref:LemA family protein n=1 Tax=Lacipirellula sp. TaxID=2691419 RepID=UPI003D0E150A